MRVGYFDKQQGQTLKDTVYFKEIPLMCQDIHTYITENSWFGEELIRDACEYAWDYDNGWEWIRAGIILTLVIDNTEYGDYEIDIDMEPLFHATLVGGEELC